MARFGRRFPIRARISAPAAVTVAVPVLPAPAPLRDRQPPLVPVKLRSQLVSGMTPGGGLSGIPPFLTGRSKPAKIQAQPRMRILAGMLPGRGLSGIPEQPAKSRAAQIQRQPRQRLSVGLMPGQGLSGIPEQLTKSRPASIQRQPRQSVRAGMLPGLGLSGIPPVPVLRDRQAPLVPARLRNQLTQGQRGSLTAPVAVPVVLRNRQKIRAVVSRLTPSPFAPAGVIYQSVSAPTIFARTRYRLTRQPPQRIATGYLPGRGLSGLPPTAFTKPRQAPLVPSRIRNQVTSGQRGSLTAPVPVPAAIRPRGAPAVPRVRARFATGFPGSLTAPVPVAVILRNRQKIRSPQNRLAQPPFIPAAVYAPVIQQARLIRPAWRLVRQKAQRVLTGMLPGLNATRSPFFEQFLGGTALQYGTYNGTYLPVSVYGGLVLSYTTAPSGFVIQPANLLGGTETPVIQMSMMQNLQAFEGNDTTFLLQITQFGNPMNLTGYTLKLYVKATQQTPDSAATVYTAGAGLTMLQIRGGEFSFVLPHAATATPGTQWWRFDIIDGSGNTGTALYGNLYILPV